MKIVVRFEVRLFHCLESHALVTLTVHRLSPAHRAARYRGVTSQCYQAEGGLDGDRAPAGHRPHGRRGLPASLMRGRPARGNSTPACRTSSSLVERQLAPDERSPSKRPTTRTVVSLTGPAPSRRNRRPDIGAPGTCDNAKRRIRVRRTALLNRSRTTVDTSQPRR